MNKSTLHSEDGGELARRLAREFTARESDATQFHDYSTPDICISEIVRAEKIRTEFFEGMPAYLVRYFHRKYAAMQNKHGLKKANDFMTKLMRRGELLRRINFVLKKYDRLPTKSKISSYSARFSDYLKEIDSAKPFCGAKTQEQMRLESKLRINTSASKSTCSDSRVLAELELDELSEMAHQFSKLCGSILQTFSESEHSCADYEHTIKKVYLSLKGVCDAFGIAAPHAKKKDAARDHECGVLKMVCDKWWLGQFKKAKKIMREHLAIAAGQVSSRAHAYVSYECLQEFKAQQKQNWRAIEQMELFDVETEETFDLKDMVLKSVGNPAIRRMELMVRTRGCEDIASELGLSGLFVTLTTPSRFHNTYKKGGFISNWDGSSPRDAQTYLNGVWARIRAQLARQGIKLFGVRVAEPHHDGTPHWHMLVWIRPDQVEDAKSVFEDYATNTDFDELKKNGILDVSARIDIKAIDSKKGSATGYIAKYISKNIDGYGMGDDVSDETGSSVSESAKSVTAWKNRWGIRQFQFVGGAPVTTYRELRRLANINRKAFHDYLMMQEKAELISIIESSVDELFVGAPLPLHRMKASEIIARMVSFYQADATHQSVNGVMRAADKGEWSEYIRGQGGVFVARKDLVVRNAYERQEYGTVYGEKSARIHGVLVVSEEVVIQTRLRNFEIRRKKKPCALALDSALAPSWSSVNNCTGAKKAVHVSDETREKLSRVGVSLDDYAGNAFLSGAALSLGDGRTVKIADGYVGVNGEYREMELVEVASAAIPIHKSGALEFTGLLSDFSDTQNHVDSGDLPCTVQEQADDDCFYDQPGLPHVRWVVDEDEWPLV